MKSKKDKLILKNKKAYFNFEIIETELCGIVLLGSEVKSIKAGKVSFTDTYCLFIGGEMWVRNLHISEYESSLNIHDPKRDKKILMTKKQLSKFKKQLEIKGLTIVPLAIQTNEKGFIKINIGLAKGKREYDKRETIKQRDTERDLRNV